MSAYLDDPEVVTGLEKVNPHPNSPKGVVTKEFANHQAGTLIFHDSKVMLKILNARLHHYVNQELPDVQSGFRQERRARKQNVNIHWIIEKAREFQKSIYIS